jgi:hypothetical protein
MAINPEAAALKTKRAAARDNPAVDESKLPVTVGQGEPGRREKLLFSPEEPRVLEATGATYGVFSGEDIPGYTRAETDAYETFLPDRCTTPVTRMRWSKGQHVPTSVYRKYLAEQDAKVKAKTTPAVTE